MLRYDLRSRLVGRLDVLLTQTPYSERPGYSSDLLATCDYRHVTETKACGYCIDVHEV